MTEALFEQTWNRWIGLWPVSSRKRGAYYESLKHIEDKRFRKIATLVEDRVDHFPTVKDIRIENANLQMQADQKPGEVVYGINPDNGKPATCRTLETLTIPELEAYYYALAELFKAAWVEADHHPTTKVPIRNALAIAIYRAGESAAIEWTKRKERGIIDKPLESVQTAFGNLPFDPS